MRTYRKTIIGILCVAFLGLSCFSATADTVTIVGTVNEDGQLVDDAGQIYTIAEDDLGWEVMDSVGEQVEVVGMVEEDEGGLKVLVVQSFKVLS
jgi:hypothetical protein